MHTNGAGVLTHTSPSLSERPPSLTHSTANTRPWLAKPPFHNSEILCQSCSKMLPSGFIMEEHMAPNSDIL